MALTFLVMTCAVGASGKPPHVALVLADDYGWANVGYHNANNREVQTPVLDRLAGGGVKLDRHYVYKFCSPTRSCLQSGRLPVHVNTVNVEPIVHNAADKVGGYAGIPVNMTGIAQKLRSAGYRCHATGKWDAGMATHRHTPAGRGYESWLGYYHHANDYYTEKLDFEATGSVDVCGKSSSLRDFWQNDGPAPYNDTTVYEEAYFLNHSLAVIRAHDPAEPLFLFHAFHLIHTPLQVPVEYNEQFSFVKDSPKQRRPYAAMVKYMDDAVGELEAALRAKGMWDDLLLVFMSDNGGPIYYPAGANNYPLKGGKMSDWEGGVRVNAFVSGGFVPAAVRGSTHSQYIHAADWYTTLCALAGVDAADPEAVAAGLPDVDGVDVWGDITGATDNSRTSIHLSECAYIEGDWKIVKCVQPMSGWTPKVFPAFGEPQPMYKVVPFDHWNQDCTKGCLFNVAGDPLEKHDLAGSEPEVLARMAAALAALNEGNYKPNRGAEDVAACRYAEQKYNNHYGPFVDVE